jgi:hypothetical protein
MAKIISPYPAGYCHLRGSFTQLNQGGRCPAEWAAGRIKGLKEQETEAALYGRVKHRLYADCGRWCFEHGQNPPPVEAIGQIFSQAMLDLKIAPEHYAHFTEKLYDFLGQVEFKPDPAYIDEVEKDLWFAVSDDPDHRLIPPTAPFPKLDATICISMLARPDRFRIDPRTGEARITDYKTAPFIMPEEQFAKDWQIGNYGLAVLANYPKQVKLAGGTFYYPERDWEMQDKVLTPDEIEWTVSIILDYGRLIMDGDRKARETIGKLLKKDPATFLLRDVYAEAKGKKRVEIDAAVNEAFPPRPGRACEPYDDVWCSYIFSCPHREPEQTGIPVVASKEEADKMLASVLWRTARTKAERYAIHTYAKVHPLPAQAGGMRARVKSGEFEVASFDYGKFLKFCKTHNLPPADYVRLDGHTIHDIKARLAAEGVVTLKPSNKFVIEKDKQEEEEDA